jgi:hypothetical protein
MIFENTDIVVDGEESDSGLPGLTAETMDFMAPVDWWRCGAQQPLRRIVMELSNFLDLEMDWECDCWEGVFVWRQLQ